MKILLVFVAVAIALPNVRGRALTACDDHIIECTRHVPHTGNFCVDLQAAYECYSCPPDDGVLVLTGTALAGQEAALKKLGICPNNEL